MDKDSTIFVAGHRGMVGSACVKRFEAEGYKNIIKKTSQDLDLRNQSDVYEFISQEKPDLIIDAAAKVGGILANNSYPYEFLMDNMLIQNNLISAAHKFDVKKFIFLGSSCIYPKLSPQPILEEYILTDALEDTNQWYAVAKISGVKLIEALRNQHGRNYLSLMPTNLYGPNDNFDLDTSHVIPAMIRKFHESKLNNHTSVKLWGTGSPMREFMHVDDMCSSIMFFVQRDFSDSLYNVGTGNEISIRDLGCLIQRVIGHKGDINWDSTKPDGTPRKLLSVEKIKKEGWKPLIDLEVGINKTYDWFLENVDRFREVKM